MVNELLEKKVSALLSCGFNSTEISNYLKVHSVTVRRIKIGLKNSYPNYAVRKILKTIEEEDEK